MLIIGATVLLVLVSFTMAIIFIPDQNPWAAFWGLVALFALDCDCEKDEQPEEK